MYNLNQSIENQLLNRKLLTINELAKISNVNKGDLSKGDTPFMFISPFDEKNFNKLEATNCFLIACVFDIFSYLCAIRPGASELRYTMNQSL